MRMKGGNRAHSLLLVSIVLLSLLIVFSLTGSAVTAQNDLSAEYAYVPNEKSNTVSVINTTTNTVVSTVTVGNVPVGVAVSPDGTKVYVTNFGNDEIPGRTVSIIDTVTEEVTPMNVEEGKPGKPSGIAVYPYGQKLYVAKFLNEKVRAVDLITSSVLDIHTGKDPFGVVITPDGSRVYVTNRGDNTVSVIDTATDNVTVNINVGEAPYGVAVNKNGTKVYVTNMNSDNVSVIDTLTNKVIADVSVGRYPHGIAVTPDEKWVYVANHNTPIGSVSVINAATNNVTDTIIVGTSPCGVAVNRDGTKVYVTNSGSNTVSVISTKTNTVIDKVDVGMCPSGLGQFICSVPGSRIETITTLTSSPDHYSTRDPITLTATVNTTSQGTERPSGTVTFIEGNTSIGTETLSSGQAILTISPLSVGSHSIIARYRDNDNRFRPSTSSSLTLLVEHPAIETTEESPIIEFIIAVISGIIVTLIGILAQKRLSSK
ncbi:collagen triple helix repeat domain protein [Methanosarcina horonobensis HB-1 = JCM 15518]|uniref:Collagen triple helix repeat domain protein n=1 Tax=Methanosarcina horonobensis HB-1 = JCM 15518 TaxID=1434110 RepID=A0A0E3WUF9_9EURY|nr:Ig-like domain repeat protein [Methanosarcina horonobensis]AKB80210.1 collagen triple helix repeat domain protein [Methanosarcina horonobensis HB-1 = JCM 15518]